MSTATTFFDFRTNSVFDDVTRDFWIGEAETAISQGAFCDKRYQAVALWAAHFSSISARNTSAANSGDAGSVRAKKQGRLSQTYGGVSSSGASNEPGFEQTAFGRDYLQMQKTLLTVGTTLGVFFAC